MRQTKVARPGSQGRGTLLLMCAILAPLATSAQTPVPTPAPDTSVKAVIAKAVSYLKDYKEALQFVLADEVTQQEIFNQRGARIGQRQSSGEYFLTYLASEGRWVGVRDVAIVDGAPVEKRNNLRELLTRASFARVGQQLADQNARYNIGTISRNFNDPMLALLILDEKHRGRFKFDRRTVERTPAGHLVTLTFAERDEPTLVHSADGRRIFSKGELTIEAATGRLLRTFITLKDKTTTVTLTTDFSENQKLGLWLPASFDERYEGQVGRMAEVVVVKSIYTNYRRFNVNVVIK